MGIAGEDAAALAKLRALPAEDVAKGLNMASMRVPTYAGGPVEDGITVLGAPTQLYAAGKGARVPVMVGATNMDIGGDEVMAEPARQIARTLSARGQPAYYFRFSYVAESLRKQTPGAPHATDIPFAFDTVAARYGKDLTAQDAALAKAMHEYWVTFARTGKPTAKGHPDWPAYNAKTRSHHGLHFGRPGGTCGSGGASAWMSRQVSATLGSAPRRLAEMLLC